MGMNFLYNEFLLLGRVIKMFIYLILPNGQLTLHILIQMSNDFKKRKIIKKDIMPNKRIVPYRHRI